MAIPDGFLDAAVRSATPIGLAALGELVVERSGVINIGLEGAISMGAVAATLAAVSANSSAGLLAGSIAGTAVAMVFGAFVTRLRTQQVITGTAVSILGVGLSATLHRTLLESEATSVHVDTLSAVPIPGLSRLPFIGSAVFNQSVPTYLLYALVPIVAFVLYRTVAGVVLRATGENSQAALSAGRSPVRIQFVAIAFGGCLAGLSGATLVLAQTGVFTDGISAGRGFIAVAVVALGGWTILGVVGGSLLFGAVGAVQYLAQSYGSGLPYNAILAAPYLATLVALALFRGVRPAPASLGRALDAPP